MKGSSSQGSAGSVVPMYCIHELKCCFEPFTHAQAISLNHLCGAKGCPPAAWRRPSPNQLLERCRCPLALRFILSMPLLSKSQPLAQRLGQHLLSAAPTVMLNKSAKCCRPRQGGLLLQPML